MPENGIRFIYGMQMKNGHFSVFLASAVHAGRGHTDNIFCTKNDNEMNRQKINIPLHIASNWLRIGRMGLLRANDYAQCRLLAMPTMPAIRRNGCAHWLHALPSPLSLAGDC